MSRNQQPLVLCLAGVAASLLLVGVVSGTMIRHLIQIVPIVFTLLITIKLPDRGAFAALPIFLFWLFIMVLIWLFLLGIAKIVTGHFTPAEIVLTITIGLFCLGGAVGALRNRPASTVLANAGAFLLLLGLQVGAMWLSLQPAFATR